MEDEPEVIRRRAKSVLDAGATLRSRSTEERAQWLEASVAAIAENTPLGQLARDTLPSETGSSDAMVAWALRATLDTVRRDTLVRLAQEAAETFEVVGGRADPISLLSLVLAGNVFTASVRGIVVPLLFGVPVLVKSSSSETRFPNILRDALRQADPELAAAMDVVTFQGGVEAREAAFLEFAEAASVYGTDETVRAIEGRLEQRIPVIAHGHGVSVAYCSTPSLAAESVEDTVSRLALDIAAYDQRGCLSPQLVYVEEAPETSIHDFAARLSAALTALEESLPRGPLPDVVGSAQTQWRGIAEVEGTLVRGREHALAIDRGDTIRWGPGYRNATIVPVRHLDDALDSMATFASHLKCVGTDKWTQPELAARFEDSSSWNAYVTGVGTMQTPALDAPADGRPIWEGLVRSRRR